MNKNNYITRYKQIPSISFRKLLRYLILTFYYWSYKLRGQIPLALKKNRVQFLYFHHIFDDEEEGFRRILRTLSREHTFISYSEAVSRILEGNIDRPYIAVSFDDGFKNCLKAAQIMNEFGIKACFFICPSIIGETDHLKIKEFCQKQMHQPPIEFLSWEDVETLLRDGHEIGSHTMTHSDLEQLSDQQMRNEIQGAYELLKNRLGSVKHFSWPYGQFSNFNTKAARIVYDTGFVSCASAVRGCHISNESIKKNDLCLRRDHIIAGWPLMHIIFFLAKNSMVNTKYNNFYPREWRQNL